MNKNEKPEDLEQLVNPYAAPRETSDCYNPHDYKIQGENLDRSFEVYFGSGILSILVGAAAYLCYSTGYASQNEVVRKLAEKHEEIQFLHNNMMSLVFVSAVFSTAFFSLAVYSAAKEIKLINHHIKWLEKQRSEDTK